MDKRKGISLIVLVITILVMIILAGVVIVALSKNNPIEKANEAKEKTEVYKEKENISLSVVAVIKNKANGLLEKTDDQVFQKKLRENFKTEKIVVGVLQNQEPSIFRITYQESGRNYFVTTTGEISEQVIQKIVLEYKTEDNQHISKTLQEYTNSSVKISSLELSEEIKKQNNYIFKNAIVLKSDETSVTLTGSDSVTLDNSILKITMIYTKKEQTKTKYTLTINPKGGTITGSTKIQGEEGSTVIIPNPTEPSGNTVTFIDGSNQSSLKTRYTFNNWMLIGPGELSINSFVFGTGNAELLARYTHDGVVLPDAYKEGYEFRGWYTSLQDGSKVGNSGEIYTPNESQTLYALYEDITKPVINSLVPRPSGVTINATDSGSGIVGYACSTLTTVPNASSFIAVSNTKNLSINVSNLLENRLYNVWVKDAAGNISNVASVTTLPKPRYTLTIDTRGGTYPSSTSIAGKEGETISISNPTPPKGPEVTFKSNGGSVSPSYITANNTFTRWSHTGGGSLNQSTYTFGNTNATLTANFKVQPVTLPNASRRGWTQTGWYTSANGGTKINTPYTPTQNITLFAQWTDDQGPGILSVTAGETEIYYTATDNGGSGIVKVSLTESPYNRDWFDLPYSFTEEFSDGYTELKQDTRYYLAFMDAYGNESSVQEVRTKVVPKYKLTIDPNGGTIPNGYNSVIEGIEGEIIRIYNVNPPAPYVIKLDAKGGTVDKSEIVVPRMLEGWKIKTGAGTVKPVDETGLWGYQFSKQDTTIQAVWYNENVLLPRATKDNAVFKGWYENGTRVGGAGDWYRPKANATLYAVWEEQLPSLQEGVNITFSQNINGWTNQNIEVTATLQNDATRYTLQLCTGDPYNEYNWIATNKVTMTENGAVYARLVSGNNKSNYVTHNVTNIDKTAPSKPTNGSASFTLNRDDESTPKSVSTWIASTDRDSGIKSVRLYGRLTDDNTGDDRKTNYYIDEKQFAEENKPSDSRYTAYFTFTRAKIDERYMYGYTTNEKPVTGLTAHVYLEIEDYAGNKTISQYGKIAPKVNGAVAPEPEYSDENI